VSEPKIQCTIWILIAVAGFHAKADLYNIGTDIFIYCQGHKVHAADHEHNASVVGYWVITPCRLVHSYGRFKITCFVHLQGGHDLR
jgi:hypothetical protein